jgi:hypothetical protein
MPFFIMAGGGAALAGPVFHLLFMVLCFRSTHEDGAAILTVTRFILSREALDAHRFVRALVLMHRVVLFFVPLLETPVLEITTSHTAKLNTLSDYVPIASYHYLQIITRPAPGQCSPDAVLKTTRCLNGQTRGSDGENTALGTPKRNM